MIYRYISLLHYGFASLLPCCITDLLRYFHTAIRQRFNTAILICVSTAIQVGNPFKSSLFGKSIGIEALEKRIEKSAEVIKTKGLKERSKKVIASIMRIANSRSDFEKALEKQGISVLFKENEQGRIYPSYQKIFECRVC